MSPNELRRLAYFPGCMSTDCARELSASLCAVLEALDIEVLELPDWNCCGGDVADSSGSVAGRPLAQRILRQAATLADELVCACPVCTGRLRSVDSTAVHSALDVLTEQHTLTLIKARRKEELEGIKAACYYGPVRDDFNGSSTDGPPMERLMRTCGVSTVKWAGRRKPHGGYAAFTQPGLMRASAGRVLTDAIDAGADVIVVEDPHAQLNLDLFQYQIGQELKRTVDIPVLFCTELVAHVLGLDITERCYRRHATPPFGMFLDYYDRRFAVVSEKAPGEPKG